MAVISSAEGLPQPEAYQGQETNPDLIECCVRGLAETVPHFRDRESAARLVAEWFPGNDFAMTSLHRLLSNGSGNRLRAVSS